ncbi:MAG: diguanylate cyclase [Campylobacterota bacterium]|nr:diguanylate cyclase [Campylobacterota bacterium]
MSNKIYFKILLIFFVPAFGMLYYSGIYVSSKYNTLTSMTNIKGGIQYIQTTEDLLTTLQKERGLSAGFIGSMGTKFSKELILQRKDTDKSYLNFKKFVLSMELKSIKHQSNIKLIQQKYSDITLLRKNIDSADIRYSDSFNNYTTINTTIIDSISYLISLENSSEISKHLLSLINIIKAKEYAGQERAVLSNYFNTKSFCSKFMSEYYITLKTIQDTNIDEFLLKADIKEFDIFQTILTQAILNDVKYYRDQVSIEYIKTNIDIDPLDWWKTSSVKVDAIGTIANSLMTNILKNVKDIGLSSKQSLIFSLLFWIIGFVSLVFTLYYLNKLVKKEQSNFDKLISQKHIYNILSQTNELIIHDYKQDELFNEICDICTHESSLSLAFIGMLDDEQNINIVASSGKAQKYLSTLSLTANPKNKQRSLGLAGKSIFEDRNIIIDDIIGDGSSLFFEVAKDYDLHSAAAYPIRKFNKVVGVVILYANDINFFEKDIVVLFDKMSNDISFALEKLYHEQMRELKAQELIYRAQHDTLTSLANRLLFNERLNYSIMTKSRTDVKGAVIFIDLDDFKPVNDNYGHHIGDLLLIKVAKILLDCVRKEDTVARIGGDEFVVLTDHLSNETAIDHHENILKISNKIRERIEQTHILEEKEINISASMGVVLFPEEFKDTTEIIKAADEAMYDSKKSGKNKVIFYN